MARWLLGVPPTIAICIGLLMGAHRQPAPAPMAIGIDYDAGKDYPAMVAIHDAGLHLRAVPDREVVAALSHPSRAVQVCALMAAARLGLADALPRVREMSRMPSAPDDYTGVPEAAQVAAARIQVAAKGQPRTSAELRTHMAAVLAATGLDAMAAETALRQCAALPAGPHRAPPNHQQRLARAAAWHIADMALRARDRGVDAPMKASPFDVTIDPAAKARAEMSSYSGQERTKRIIDILASTGVYGLGQTYLVQILIDQGPPVRAPVAAKLREWAADPPGKHTSGSFSAFLNVLVGVGADAEASAAVDALMTHSDRRVRYYAKRAHETIASGRRYMAILGY